MNKQLKVLMIGAHLDDNDFEGGGTALKYIKAGHKVQFLSMCNGCGGHHENTPEEIAKRRYKEAQNVAQLTGVKYDVWDINDCELMADLETRKKLVRYIREFNPDIIFSHRTNDYHADHRNAGVLVQDASYLLIVPNFCPEVPAMEEMPVIMYFRDPFTNPPFTPNVVISIDNVIDKKFDMYDCHVSQVYEWLPFTHGELDKVPSDKLERKEWYRSPRIPRDKVLSVEELQKYKSKNHSEYWEAMSAAKYRDIILKYYGEKANEIIFAEPFQLSEYGKQPDENEIRRLFPF
ncbi:MAG: PIG-L family deacetylase [Clostridiales bacterium]|nr:PIG-L family deacetylase [Clostridiales bacterium]